MRRRSIMKIGNKRNQIGKKKLNRHRRHYYMLFETLPIVSHPTKRYITLKNPKETNSMVNKGFQNQIKKL
jgi:hypothetical protein